MEQSHRVAPQNAIEIRGRKFQLLDEGIRIFDILRGKQIRADHDAIRTDFVDEETQGLRIVVQVISRLDAHLSYVNKIGILSHTKTFVETKTEYASDTAHPIQLTGK